MNTIILSGGYTLESAEEAISEDLGDLVSFGRPFLTNPDLSKPLQQKSSAQHQIGCKHLVFIRSKRLY